MPVGVGSAIGLVCVAGDGSGSLEVNDARARAELAVVREGQSGVVGGALDWGEDLRLGLRLWCVCAHGGAYGGQWVLMVRMRLRMWM